MMSAINTALETPADTQALGAEVAALAQPGDLILLVGPLGAGKTTFAQGVGAGLGVDGAVTSPTFVIARVHRGGRLPLVHVDAYRLGGVAEIDDLDLDASVEESLTLVEWGSGLAERLTEDHLEVQLARDSTTETRTATLIPHGPSWSARLQEATQARSKASLRTK